MCKTIKLSDKLVNVNMTLLQLTFFLLVFPIFCHSSGVKTDSKLFAKEKVALAPCQACRTLVDSFKKGLERTARGKFEGGDAAWEEERLGSYARSEVRLVEIQEKLCVGLDRGEEQCHTLAEESEQIIEHWWFNKQKEEPDLFKYLCITNIKTCCPDKHFGPECTPCAGYPDNICSKNGKCKGSGTRKGNGQCACDKGYSGELCSKCAINHYESYRDSDKLLCSPCHSSCQDSCSQAGPKGCSACKHGWIMDTEKGCYDINECTEENVCKKNEFCVNNEGSYSCLACDRACASCQGDGPDMCDECAEGYILKDNVCIDGSQLGMEGQVSTARYLTYFGLCMATCIVFQKSTVMASIIGLTVALYISVSEYMLTSKEDGTGSNSDLSSLFMSSS